MRGKSLSNVLKIDLIKTAEWGSRFDPHHQEEIDIKCSKIFKMCLVLFGEAFSIRIELGSRGGVGRNLLDKLIQGIVSRCLL